MSMTLIEHIELGSAASSITFSSIPQTYTDLIIKVSARSSRADANDWFTLLFNGSSASFTGRNLYSVVGSGVYSGTFIQIYIPATNIAASTFGSSSIYIPNYTSSANKSFSVDSVVESNSTFGIPYLQAGLWSNTAAITSVELDSINGNFVQYTSASLFGITAGSDGTTTVS